MLCNPDYLATAAIYAPFSTGVVRYLLIGPVEIAAFVAIEHGLVGAAIWCLCRGGL